MALTPWHLLRFACFVVSASAIATEDLGWDLLATTIERTTSRTCMKAPNLPSYTDGMYIVSGPAQFELGDYKLQALFDGFGLVNRFEMRPNGANGEVCYTNNWLNSSMKEASLKKGYFAGFLFEDTLPPRPSCPVTDPICNMKVLSDNDWVNLITVGDQVLALTDTHAMLRIDLNTLETNGLQPWVDDVAPMGGMGAPIPSWAAAYSLHPVTAGSAHPTIRPGTKTYIDVLEMMGPVPVVEKNYLMVYSFDADAVGPQNRTLIASLPFAKLPYIHSFGVTPNYIVLPVTHKMDDPDLFNPILLSKIGEGWMGLKIVDKNGNVHHFDLPEEDRFYHVHTVNAFENSSGITLDVGAFPRTPFAKDGALDIKMFKDKHIRDGDTNKNVIKRVHFPFGADGHFPSSSSSKPLLASSEDLKMLPGSRSDFFKINPKYTGLPYCLLYATQWWHDGENYASMAIVKKNVCTGESTYWSRPNVYVGEPELIPGPGAEEDGVVSFVALDGQKEKSIFVTLDAHTMAEIALVELPEHIPFTAHGMHFPSVKARTELVV